MSERELTEARKQVERAMKEASAEEERRTAGYAMEAAVRRVAANNSRKGLRRFLFENGLVLTATLLFLLSFVGQVAAGRAYYNEEQRSHHEAEVGLMEYFHTGAFVEATAENWESEFLQIGLFVILTAYLYQRGSSESKALDTPEAVDQPPEEARNEPNAPGPVRRGGFPLALYRHSLSIALFTLFAMAFIGHVLGGAADYNADQKQHGEATVTAIGYLKTSRFWFESFQNWQSEFLSVAVLVLLTIWLREQGSPQSKPVAASHYDTGE